jgi:hypothetical protein
MMINKLFVFLLLTLVSSLAYTQEPLDSTFWDAEMEDTLDVLSIKPVRKPKKLIKQVMERFQTDLEQTHKARKYLAEGIFQKSPRSPSFSASCLYSVEGDNGLEIMGPSQNIRTSKLELLHYEGPDSLTSQDSITLISILRDLLLASPIHRNNEYEHGYNFPAPFVYYEELNRWYDIKAYEINYGSGRGLYRIHLDKKKDRRLSRPNDREHWYGNYSAVAYFDRSTLLITQYKGVYDFVSEEEEEPFPSGAFSQRCQIDYDEEGGAPLLKRVSYIETGDFRTITGTVQRIDSQ